MKRLLALISISCGLGVVGWGVGGCGSGSTTTTPDGFPLVGGGYNLKSDLDADCTSLFGENIELGIIQDSSNLDITFTEGFPSFETQAEGSGIVDKDANIEFSGDTKDSIPFTCSTTAVIQGSSKNDITLPLTCSVGDSTCEVVYGNLFSDGL